MVFVLGFFLIFLAAVQKFSAIAGVAHDISARLENKVQQMMDEKGRPVCLEAIEPPYVRGEKGNIVKSLTFVRRPICREENR